MAVICMCRSDLAPDDCRGRSGRALSRQNEAPGGAPDRHLGPLHSGVWCAKTFVLLYRLRGKWRRMSLRRYPNVKLAAARKRADAALREVSAGRDPQAAKGTTRTAPPGSFGPRSRPSSPSTANRTIGRARRPRPNACSTRCSFRPERSTASMTSPRRTSWMCSGTSWSAASRARPAMPSRRSGNSSTGASSRS